MTSAEPVDAQLFYSDTREASNTANFPVCREPLGNGAKNAFAARVFKQRESIFRAEFCFCEASRKVDFKALSFHMSTLVAKPHIFLLVSSPTSCRKIRPTNSVLSVTDRCVLFRFTQW